jgi:uncharacterized membrane protein
MNVRDRADAGLRRPVGYDAVMTGDAIDVSVVMLGLDASARAAVQRAMRDIAERGDSSRPEGLVAMLREAIAVLRGASSSWTHAGALDHAPMPPAEAEAAFRSAAHRARSRFEHELVRNADGATTHRPAPPLPTDPSEPGVVVVTLVVAARGELLDVRDVRDRAALERALDALSALEPRAFVAMEVVWSPADENDRASVASIEARYPELVRLPRA